MRNRAMFLLAALALGAGPQAEAPPKPLLKDFVGINGHFTFKPKLYAPAVRLVRNYHGVEWDLGKETDYVTRMPFARNRVNWADTYGSWKAEGFTIDASLMFADLPQELWKNPTIDGHRYAKAVAAALGPSTRNLLSSAEIGNEPGHYDDAFYRTLFEAMARGLREGDPNLRIATCAVVDGKSHKYAKSLDCVKGLEALYDILNVHTYAEAEPWPTWRRSYPEDPAIPYLKDVDKVLAWRNAHAPGKQIWITEFGWDSSTKTPPKTGDFAKWVGVTDQQQAQYLVRSTLVFMAMDVARAYIYFYDDKDEPSLHAASGLTRNFQPKPSYHAVAHLQRSLGEYRLARVRESKAGDCYAYLFTHGGDPSKRVLVAWSPTGSGRSVEIELDLGAPFLRAERMPLVAGEVPAESVESKGGLVRFKLTESPLYLWFGGK